MEVETIPAKQRPSQRILQDELDKRKQQNPQYSLRRFAKALGLSPTLLSLLIQGKRRLTKQTALKVSQLLPLTPEDRELLFRESLQVDFDSEGEGFFTTSLPFVFSQNLDIRDIIILEYLNTEQACDGLTEEELAKHLNLPIRYTQEALRRLRKAELVKLNDKFVESGRYAWMKSVTDQHFFSDKPLSALVDYHQQLLYKAQQSLVCEDKSRRAIETMTFAMNPDRFEYFRNKMIEFVIDFQKEILEDSGKKDVFSLVATLFPHTKSESNHEVH